MSKHLEVSSNSMSYEYKIMISSSCLSAGLFPMATKMHVSNNGGSQKRKRGERTFKFETFCDPEEPTNFSGSFYENVRALLDCGHMKATAKQGEAKCSSFKLELQSHPPSFVRLYIAEEAVGRSQYRQCQYCRSVGWSHHMICNERFHFVLPSKDTSLNGSDGLSIQVIYNGQSRNKAIASRSNLGHSMHAVVHSNGYGHLLYINGYEGGSDLLSGHQIVDFWDRICTALHVRKISLTDVAKKGTMELRLIHGVAYGEPWFGRWGFKYGHGSYGVTQQMHQQSLEQLQAIPLSLLASGHFACTYAGSSDNIPMLIAKYQALGGHKLIQTLGNLFRFMMELKSRLPINSLTGAAADYHDGTAAGPAASCRWSTKRVETAAHVIVEALKKFQMRWVTRQDVREAARAYVGDTGLLDYVLKSLGNHIVGNYIVRRSVNPVTKVLEYSLEDASNVCPNFHSKFMVRFQLTRVQLMRDLLHFYKIILKDNHQRPSGSILDIIPLTVRNILDTKHLVKDYRERSISLQMMNHQNNSTDQTIHLLLFCNVLLRCNHTKEIKFIRKELPQVFEIIRVHPRATVSELKKEVEKHFRELYWGLRSFDAESIVDASCKDFDIVSEVIKPGTRVIIQGSVDHQESNNNGELFEGEIDEVVFCLCGARDEDGERMICCDICEVWQHTRCVGIRNDEDVPRVFLCNRCENDIVALPAIQF